MKANVRTTTAAQSEGQAGALTIAFYGGSIMGLCRFAAPGLGFLLAWERPRSSACHPRVWHGRSSVALFSRVGGGITPSVLTWAPTSWVKSRLGFPKMIPETLVTDNVGDNVGDVAGMGSTSSNPTVAP